MKTRIEKIERICQAAEIIGLYWTSTYEDYQRINEELNGKAITVENVIGNHVIPILQNVPDRYSRIERLANMLESDFQKAYEETQVF